MACWSTAFSTYIRWIVVIFDGHGPEKSEPNGDPLDFPLAPL